MCVWCDSSTAEIAAADAGARSGKPLLVFAGNARQAEQWAFDKKRLPRKAWRYVGSPDALRGYTTVGQPRVIVGSFYERRDAQRMLEMLAICDSAARARGRTP